MCSTICAGVKQKNSKKQVTDINLNLKYTTTVEL